MLSYLWVSIGGAIGSAARFWISGIVAERYGQTFPYGTLVVNVTGSFIIGIFAALTDPEGRWLVSPSFRQFFMIGVCGGYTTFSSFSLQTLALAHEGNGFVLQRMQWRHSPSVSWPCGLAISQSP